jgi:hypothetical protein
MSKSDAPQISYDSFSSSKKSAGLVIPLDQKRTVQYLDVGAVDVLTSPLLKERLPSLGIHAYRAHRDASKDHRALLEMKRGRKRSWVGVDDQKPYAYLREAMVSGLMDGICKVGDDHEPPWPAHDENIHRLRSSTENRRSSCELGLFCARIYRRRTSPCRVTNASARALNAGIREMADIDR